MARTTTFRITRPGANHWGPPDAKSGERKRYGYGDTIELPASAATDPKYNNLGLVLGGRNAPADVAAQEAELGQEPANPAVKPAAGDIGGDEDEDKSEDKAKLEALIAELEDSNGNAEFQAARQKVIDADIFEADTVPTKKAELLQALIDLRDGEDEDE